MDKYKQYIDVHWWNGIEKRDVENWIRNFGNSKELAQLILDNVIFYNGSQLKEYTRFLVNKLKEQVYMKTMEENHYSFVEDEVLIRKWDDYLKQTKFVPAALQSDPTSSAHKIIGYWRSALRKGENLFSVIADIDKNYKMGTRRFVLVDDFSGSGEQMQKVLKQRICFDGRDIEIGKLGDAVEDIELIIAVYVIHEKARTVLEEKYPNIKVIYVDLLDDNLNYMNKNSLIYEGIGFDKRQDILNAIQRINESIMEENDELINLSTYILNIPVVFEHGCPNNTLFLLFAHSDNWQQLFKRGNEI